MQINIVLLLVLVAAGLGIGAFIGALIQRKTADSRIANAERDSAQIVEEAKKEADTIRKEAVIQA